MDIERKKTKVRYKSNYYVAASLICILKVIADSVIKWMLEFSVNCSSFWMLSGIVSELFTTAEFLN